MIQAYIGDGKGKTTCAIGLSVRAFGFGKKVLIIFFDKGSKTYSHNELISLDKLGIKYVVTGLERMQKNGKFRFGVTDEDKNEANKGIELALNAIKNNEYDLVILDEVLSSYTYGLLNKDSIIELIRLVPENLELIMTGRCNDESIIDKCDLVTSMTKIKHYFDKGTQARPGIEY